MVTQVSLDVLEAAVDCLSIGPLRVDDVARRAGCNKRMIYHYYGNKAGLITAARASQVELLAGSRLVSAATRGVLRSLVPELRNTKVTASHGRLQRAARIVLLWLLEVDARESLRTWTSGDWQLFALELTTLALRGEPLKAAEDAAETRESEDLLTGKETKDGARQKKPSIRLASVSRPRRP